jgi:hypothetical protein
VLVGLQRYHVEENRLIMASAAIAPFLLPLTLPREQRRLVAFQERQWSPRKLRHIPFTFSPTERSVSHVHESC